MCFLLLFSSTVEEAKNRPYSQNVFAVFGTRTTKTDRNTSTKTKHPEESYKHGYKKWKGSVFGRADLWRSKKLNSWQFLAKKKHTNNASRSSWFYLAEYMFHITGT